jgi:protein TonB
MSEAQFQDEVSRRLALEVQKLETKMQARAAASASRVKEASVPAEPPAAPAEAPPVEPAHTPLPEPTPPPTPAPVSAERIAPTAPPAPAPAPTRVAIREGALIALEDADSPPRITKIVKPSYPPFALQAHIGGIVVLRVLVSEQGTPLQIEVTRRVGAGLTEAAVEAVRRWVFEPARKDGLPVRTWMVIPIPFEP